MGMLGFDSDRRLGSHAEADFAPRKSTKSINKCQLIQQSQSFRRSCFQPGDEFCLSRGLMPRPSP